MKNRLHKMAVLPVEMYVFHGVVPLLMRRGHGFTEAKRLVRQSGLLEHAKEVGWMVLHSYSLKDWAEWVDSKVAKKPEKQFAFSTGEDATEKIGYAV